MTNQIGYKSSRRSRNMNVCPYCSGPVVKVDHYGEVLVGCIECNRWGHPGDKKLVMELMDEDVEVLRRGERE